MASTDSCKPCLVTIGFISLPGQRTAGPAIFPRRKGKSNSKGPIILTLDLMKRLEIFPLTEAARQVGVSATAFKHACRKLGIVRWAYKKKSGVALTAIKSESGYVQCLFGKQKMSSNTVLNEPAFQHLSSPEAHSSLMMETLEDSIQLENSSELIDSVWDEEFSILPSLVSKSELFTDMLIKPETEGAESDCSDQHVSGNFVVSVQQKNCSGSDVLADFRWPSSPAD
jgi:hypothetical protein